MTIKLIIEVIFLAVALIIVFKLEKEMAKRNRIFDELMRRLR